MDEDKKKEEQEEEKGETIQDVFDTKLFTI